MQTHLCPSHLQVAEERRGRQERERNRERKQEAGRGCGIVEKEETEDWQSAKDERMGEAAREERVKGENRGRAKVALGRWKARWRGTHAVSW